MTFLLHLEASWVNRGHMKTPLRALFFVAAFSLSLIPAFAGGWGDNYQERLVHQAEERDF